MMIKRILLSALIVFLGMTELQQAEAQSDIWNCSRCGRRVWDSDSGRPRPSACPYCSGGGSGSSGWSGVGQSLGNSFMQGYQQGIAAQQEAARRAAEEAAAAERRRQELLQKAAEEARINWEQQDAANMAEFGKILSSKKTGGGMSPLLMKQAQQSSGVWNDPNVVDLSDTMNRTPHIPGSETASPFGSPLLGEPIHESSLHPLAGLSDEQLEKKKAVLDKSIADIQKLMEQNSKEYEVIATEAQIGMNVANQARFDAGTTLAFGGLQGLAGPKADSALAKSINLPGGTAAKKEAMREAVRAAKDVRAIETGAQGSDAIGLASTLSFTDDTGDKLATAATAAGGLIVKSPLGAVPGVVKTGLDTGWAWSDYFMLKQQYDRREKLRKQYEDAFIHLSSDQAAVVAEQKRRKAQ